MKKILIIEDNRDVRENTADILELEGYEVASAENGLTGVERAKELLPDIIVCDIMMPELDGYGVLEELNKDSQTSSIPFIFLTAKTEKTDMRKGMNLGADDYLTKPFHFEELLSRINALSRRKQYHNQEKPKSPILEFDELQIDTDQYKVFLKGELVDLSPREFKLLMYLIENRNKTVSRMQILNAVWGITFNNHSNVVDVYISYLRNKVENQDQKFIQTVKGIGYMFKYDS